MKVKIKKLHSNAVIPKYALPGDAAMDLTATSIEFVELRDGSKIMSYGVGLALEIPDGYYACIRPRSSISKTSLILCNSPGIIDSKFRGEILIKFRIDANARPVNDFVYKVGDRIAQLMILPYPQIEFEEVNELTESERSTGGFGSTGV